jgi:hypothetical protein
MVNQKGTGVRAKEDLGFKRLGVLAIYSLSDIEVKAAKLKEVAKDVGLHGSFLPPELREIDAFRRATGEIGDRKRTDRQEPIVIREIGNDTDSVIRILEKRMAVGTASGDIKKGDKATLDYQHIGTMVFDKKTGHLDLIPLDKSAAPIMGEARDRYKKYCEYYGIAHIRRMVQTAFEKCFGVNYRRNGGASFIPNAYADSMELVADLLKRLPGDCELDIIQVVDTEGHREDIKAKLEAHVTDAMADIARDLGVSKDALNARLSLRGMVEELSQLSKSNVDVGKRAVQTALDKFAGIKETIGQYKILLECNMETVDSEMDIAKKQLAKIMTKIDEE